MRNQRATARPKLTLLQEALEDVSEQNYREFDEENDEGPCSDCAHYEEGYCDVLEMGVAADWTCDAYDESEMEEADEEVAQLIADGTDEAEVDEDDEPVEEHRTPAQHDHPHGGVNKGKMGQGNFGGRKARLGPAAAAATTALRQWAYNQARKRARGRRGRRRTYAEASDGPFAQYLRELREHNVVPHGPGHGGKRGYGPVAGGKVAGKGKLLHPDDVKPLGRKLAVPRKGQKIGEEDAKVVVQQAAGALRDAGLNVYVRTGLGDAKLGGLAKADNAQNWQVRDGDGQHSGWGLGKGQIGVGVAVQGRNLYADADNFVVSRSAVKQQAAGIEIALRSKGFDVAEVRDAGYDGGWGSYNVNFEAIINKPAGGVSEAAIEEHNIVPHGPGHGGRKGRGGGAGFSDIERGGQMRAAGIRQGRPALAKKGRALQNRGVLAAGKRFGGANGPAQARVALQALQAGDRVRVAIKQVGMRGEVYKPRNLTGSVEQVRANGVSMQIKSRDGVHVIKASDLVRLQLDPPKAPRRAGPIEIKHFNDAETSEFEANLGEALRESSDLGGVVLDEAAKSALRKDGTFPVKIIDAGWGSSGYYSHAVLKRAAEAGRFPAGLKMYWDHPTKTEATERPERSLRDLAAVTVSHGKYRDDGPDGPGVYAEAKAFQQYRPYIEELAPHIGISMRGYGNTKMGEAEGKKGALVEDIVAVQSADFVTQPGRGGKILQLFEAARQGAPIEATEVEESDMDPEEIQALQESNHELMESTARLQEQLAIRDARDMVRDALESSGLPPVTRRRLIESLPNGELPFVDTNDALDRAAFATQIDEAIKAEQQYIQDLGGPVVRGLGEAAGGAGAVTADSAQKELDEALAGLIGDPEKAKHAIAGRVN